MDIEIGGVLLRHPLFFNIPIWIKTGTILTSPEPPAWVPRSAAQDGKITNNYNILLFTNKILVL